MKIRRKLVIDVTYDNVEEGDEEQLERNLNFVASHAMGEGLLTNGVDHVEVDTHTVRLSELEPRLGEVDRTIGDVEVLRDGDIRGIVKVDFSEFGTEGESFVQFLDALSRKLTSTEILSNINYQIVDVDGYELVVEVEGDPSMITDGPVAKLLGREES